MRITQCCLAFTSAVALVVAAIASKPQGLSSPLEALGFLVLLGNVAIQVFGVVIAVHELE